METAHLRFPDSKGFLQVSRWQVWIIGRFVACRRHKLQFFSGVRVAAGRRQFPVSLTTLWEAGAAWVPRLFALSLKIALPPCCWRCSCSASGRSPVGDRQLRQDMMRLLGAQQFSAVSIVAAQLDAELDTRLQALVRVAPTSPGNDAQSGRIAEISRGPHDFPGLFNGGTRIRGGDARTLASVPYLPNGSAPVTPTATT